MTRATLAWCLYDLANTIFAMNMTSYHFPVWVVSDLKQPEIVYSLAFGISMLASALLMPRLGRHSDGSGKRVRLLAGWTAACVVLTAAISLVRSVWVALVFFALANFCYQIAGIFYNALLPAVSPPKKMGRVSGYGVALGYVGTLIGILATAPIVTHWGRQATFWPTGLLFFLLALPSFFLIPERSAPAVEISPQAQAELRKKLKPLLVPSFLGLAALGTAILFMSVYGKQAIGLSDKALQDFLIAATLVTIAASFFWGRLTDRIGGARTLHWVWLGWVLVFGLAAVSFHPAWFLFVGSLSGITLGGTWVASRVLLVELVGPHQIGEAFGLFGLISRASAVAGPVAWAGILWLAEPLGMLRYRLAMLFLMICVAIGWWLYGQVKIERA